MKKSAAYWEGYSAGLEKVGVSLKWVKQMLGPKNIEKLTELPSRTKSTDPRAFLKEIEKRLAFQKKYPKTKMMLARGEPYSEMGMRSKIMRDLKKKMPSDADIRRTAEQLFKR